MIILKEKKIYIFNGLNFLWNFSNIKFNINNIVIPFIYWKKNINIFNRFKGKINILFDLDFLNFKYLIIHKTTFNIVFIGFNKFYDHKALSLIKLLNFYKILFKILFIGNFLFYQISSFTNFILNKDFNLKKNYKFIDIYEKKKINRF